jgi:Flp pilus assembly protein protease CpaA
MGAKQSAEMAKARELVEKHGKTPYAAALAAGITKSAIYQSTWYKDRRNGLSRNTVR